MRIGNKFINPATGAVYTWPINHREEEEAGPRTNLNDGAPTSGLGLMPQQGADDPLVLRYRGTILTKAQLDTMLDWKALCDTQTIYFEDFAGEKFEVTITAFTYARVAVAHNPRDPTNARLWKWTYTIEMRVLRSLAGVLVGVVP